MVGLRHQTTTNESRPQVKTDSTPLRASHVNTDTSDDDQRTLFPNHEGPVVRPSRYRVERSGDDRVTPLGGVGLAASLVRRLHLSREIDARVHVLRRHLPYRESDHVLAHALNLFSGGECLEDMAALQTSGAVCRMLGACRLPDPTTGGDFLRRFDDESLRGLDAAIDAAQQRVWKKRFGKRKQRRVTVDIDSTLCPVYGNTKEGADFNYKGAWSYHPLVVSIDGTNEVLRIVNRPGNAHSVEGAASVVASVAPMLKERFHEVVLRGDNAFACQEVMQVCEEHRMRFALVCKAHDNLVNLANGVEETEWKPFRTRSARARRARAKSTGYRKRRRPRNLRRATVKRRGKRNLELVKQWVAELPYSPTGCDVQYRLVIRRQLISETDPQGHLFEKWRYRFCLTNLDDCSADDVVDLTYERCDQENVIEQLKNGVSGLGMPTASAIANAAFLRCARLAANLKSWLALLVLPAETIRWQWKRFRLAFVYVAVEVIRHARQVILRILGSSRFHDRFQVGLQKLQT